MDERRAPRIEDRILIHTPSGSDAGLTRQFLVAGGHAAHVCASFGELIEELAFGAGAVLLAEEALHPAALQRLVETLSTQPEWSDLPLVIFTTGRGGEVVLDTIGGRANVTILERPVRVRTLLAAARAAVRARARQYHARELLERLAESDQRKDEFLATLGHELRSPLAAIRAAISNLTRGLPEDAASRQRAIIDRQSANLARLVEDLLDLSRITSGKLVLRRGRVDLNEVVHRVAHGLEATAHAKGHRLEIKPGGAAVLVDGDAVRLDQIVTNLVTNAIKYTPPRGRISVTLGTEFDRAALRVADTGVGIPPGLLQRIFEPFFQIPTSVEHSQGGLGLGLPLVHKLVHLHGGEIHAWSEGQGKGSVFTLTLPLAGAAAAEAPAPPPALRPERPLRILIVEDNDDLREAMRQLVAIWGHDVVAAADGLEAVRIAQVSQPDVALVDLGLPGVDGLEVARRLRAAELPRRPRLVALTGLGGEASERALAAGFDRHLLKPVDHAELERVLSDVAAQ